MQRVTTSMFKVFAIGTMLLSLWAIVSTGNLLWILPLAASATASFFDL